MITLTHNIESFDSLAADRIVRQIINKPDSVIGLSTGRTTGAMHRILASRIVDEDIDVSRVTFFGLDEVTGVDPTFPGACVAMLKNELIDKIGYKDCDFLMLPTSSLDFAGSCREFADELKSRGGIDFLVLGLGENGHLGFNQPGSPFGCTARVTDMDPALYSRLCAESGRTGLRGATLGIKDIMHARHILLVAKGANKTQIAAQMLLGPVTEDLPASVLQLHPSVEFLFDADAAALIPENSIC